MPQKNIQKIIFFLILFFGIFGLAKSSRAAPINATSCNAADVQTAINAATDGDTVNVPSGTCNWSSTDVIGWTNKNINLIGGYGGTTTINNVKKFAGITTDNPSKASWRLSGFTINVATAENNIIVTSGGSSAQIKGWRIDHVNIYSSANGSNGILVAGIQWGLIDHCTFTSADSISVQGVEVDGLVDFDSGHLQGYTYGNLTLNQGSDEAVYIEDCTFTYNTDWRTSPGSVYNSKYAARVVFRHNNVNGSMFQNHQVRTNDRDASWVEAYNNVFNGTCSKCEAGTYLWPFAIRAGSGVFFKNRITNYGINSIQIDNARTYESEGGVLGYCDGSHPLYDGNIGSGNQVGWPCLDQIGWVGAYPTQTNVPIYAWYNSTQADCATDQSTCDGLIGLSVRNDMIGNHPWMSDHIKTTGDADPHPGNVVDYVNNGKTAKPGYMPYTYPHPLQGNTPLPVPPPTTYNITNFTQLVSDWLKTISNSPADVNTDGTVNAKDLGIMMSKWN